MKKKIYEKIGIIIFMILTVFTMINYRYIIAFATNTSLKTIKKGDVYKKGDIISFEEDDGSYGSYIANTLLIYTDTEGNILTAYRNSGKNLSKKTSYEIGLTCNEALPFSAADCKNTEKNDAMLYTANESKMANISKWIIQEVGERNVNKICEDYESLVKGSYICNNLVENVEDGSGNFLYSRNNYYDRVIILREYEDASFKLNCEPSKINYTEKTVCTLNATSKEDKITEVKFKLSNKYLEVEKIEGINNWKYNKTEDTLVFTNTEGAKDSFDVAKITLKANENINAISQVETGTITYKVNNSEETHSKVLSTIEIKGTAISSNEKEEIENPNTSSPNVALLLIVSIISLYAVIIIYKKKKMGI